MRKSAEELIKDAFHKVDNSWSARPEMAAAEADKESRFCIEVVKAGDHEMENSLSIQPKLAVVDMDEESRYKGAVHKMENS